MSFALVHLLMERERLHGVPSSSQPFPSPPLRLASALYTRSQDLEQGLVCSRDKSRLIALVALSLVFVHCSASVLQMVYVMVLVTFQAW